MQESTDEPATTSSPTPHFSCMFQGTPMKRRLLVPTASPIVGAVGSWGPPTPSEAFCCLGLRLQLTRPFLQGLLTCIAVGVETVHHLSLELPLELLSCVWSQARLYSEELPRLVLLVVEALLFVCSRLPSLSTSPQVTWPHVHEDSILACGFDVEVHRFVNWSSLPRLTRLVPFVRRESPCESEGAFVCRAGRALVMVWLFLADGRLLVAHGPSINVT